MARESLLRTAQGWSQRQELGQEPERAEVYRPQLEAYSRALSRVLERNISERILYFFATGQEISL